MNLRMLRSRIFAGIKSKKNIAWVTGAPAAMAIGVSLRLWLYLLNDSFWRDETKLLLNVAHKSFLQLLGPLNYGQEAPVPLLWLYRLFYLMGAGGELPIRAVSLVMGIGALYLFYRLAQRVLPERRAVLLVTWLMALAPGAILVGAMAKQYSLDLLVACALLYVAAPWFTASEGNLSFSRLVVAGGLAPWFSLPAVWLSGCIGLALLGQGRRRGFKLSLVYLGVLSFSFFLEFWLILRYSLHLKKFIAPGFLPLTMEGAKFAWQRAFFAYHGPQQSSMLVLCVLLGLVLMGAWEVLRTAGWEWLVALLLPLFLVFGANLVNVYPMYGRALLFVEPGLYLLLGYSMALLLRPAYCPRLATLLLALLLLPPLNITVTTLMRPVGGVREALEFIALHQQPRDLVFFDMFAAPTVAYYCLLKRPYAISLHYGWQPKDWIVGKLDAAKIRTAASQPLASQAGIWLVAETFPYARGWPPGSFLGVVPYWQQLVWRLEDRRSCSLAYITERVELFRFGPNLLLGHESRR
jgi:hypothetical protein